MGYIKSLYILFIKGISYLVELVSAQDGRWSCSCIVPLLEMFLLRMHKLIRKINSFITETQTLLLY